MLLDVMYPAIVCSFLLLLKHYAKVGCMFRYLTNRFLHAPLSHE